MHSFRTEKQNHFVIFDILYMEYSSNIGILLDFVTEKNQLIVRYLLNNPIDLIETTN